MWIVTNTLNAPPAAVEHMVDAFRRSLPDMESFEGFLSLEIWRRQDGSMLVVTRWTSEEAFSKYPQSEAFRRHHAGVPQGPGAPDARIDQYESLLYATAEAAARDTSV